MTEDTAATDVVCQYCGQIYTEVYLEFHQTRTCFRSPRNIYTRPQQKRKTPKADLERSSVASDPDSSSAQKASVRKEKKRGPSDATSDPERFCIYCEMGYRGSLTRHKLTKCPDYPTIERARCKYCDQAFVGKYADHLISDCQSVVERVKQAVRIDCVPNILRSERKSGNLHGSGSVHTVRGGGKRTKPQ